MKKIHPVIGIRKVGETILKEYKRTIDSLRHLDSDLQDGSGMIEVNQERNKALASQVKACNGMTQQTHAMVNDDKLNYALARAEVKDPGTLELMLAVSEARVTGDVGRVDKLVKK